MAEENVLNMSLDDIIKQKSSEAKSRSGPKEKRQRGRGEQGAGKVRIAVAKSGIRKTGRSKLGRSLGQKPEGPRARAQYNDSGPSQPRNPDALNGSAAWEHDLFEEGQPQARRVRPAAQGFKILITNLDYKVTDEDVQELFENCGPVIKAGIIYDRSGRSEEAAEVIFQKREDAIAAVNQYNNLALDNKPMKIELVENVGGARTLASGLKLGGQNARAQPRRLQQSRQNVRQNRATGVGRSKGQGQARGRGAAVSMNELDKDLDSYMATE